MKIKYIIVGFTLFCANQAIAQYCRIDAQCVPPQVCRYGRCSLRPVPTYTATRTATVGGGGTNPCIGFGCPPYYPPTKTPTMVSGGGGGGGGGTVPTVAIGTRTPTKTKAPTGTPTPTSTRGKTSTPTPTSPTKQLGDRCVSDRECEPFGYCTGVCTQKGRAGFYCNRNAMCASPLTCISNVCR